LNHWKGDVLAGEKAMNSESLDHRPRYDPLHEEDAPLKVGLRSYRRFCLRMDDELAALVAQWAHTAAPGASRAIPRLASQAAELP
jgi:hypothetical protein